MIPIQEKPNQIQLQKPAVGHFVNYCLMGGATVYPIDVDVHDPMWPGYCNPSIMWDEKDQNFKMIVRNVNHVLHGVGEPIKAAGHWGPVLYSIPNEDGRNLKTQNYIGVCKDPLKDPWEFQLIKTNPYKPIWEFQGEEDARIVRWDDKLYATGVRRDDNTQGCGRMELMHLSENGYQEVTRTRVGAVNEKSYCEKNWMAIKDLPFYYVQQTNPTVVVKTDPKTGITQEVVHKEHISGLIDETFDLLRGSSTVIRWGEYWMAIVHTCEMWYTANNRKYSRYCHCFVLWDEDWNIVKMSPLFSFADFNIEFTCGLEYHDGKFYIPFAIEDNFAYLMIVDECVVKNFIDNDESVKLADTEPALIYNDKGMVPYMQVFKPTTPDNIEDQKKLYEAAMWYMNNNHLAATYCILMRSCEIYSDVYAERFMAARAIADLGHRDDHEIDMWMWAIMQDDTRPEAYMGAAMYYLWRGHHIEALYFCRKAIECLNNIKEGDLIYYNNESIESMWHKCLYDTPYYETAIQYMDDHKMEHETNRRAL